MVDRKLIVLGVLIGISFNLNAFGVFTSYWIVDSFGYHSGIVPYDQYAEVWFAAATFSMYFSFVLFCFMTLIYIYSFFLVYRNGYARSTRKWFKLISNASGMIFIFTVLAMILIGVNISNASDNYDRYTLGYSAWLCVASAALSFCAFIDVVIIANRECR